MAATAWKLFVKAKKKLGNGTIQLGGSNVLKMQLHTSASTLSANYATISMAASCSNEVASSGGGNAYATGGKALASIVWTITSSSYKLDAADPVWTATTSAIANIKYAVIRNSTGVGVGHALCYSKLTTAQFTLALNNTLTVQFATAGIFTLS